MADPRRSTETTFYGTKIPNHVINKEIISKQNDGDASEMANSISKSSQWPKLE